MVDQYLRVCEVSVNGVVVKGGGNDDLRIRFDVHQGTTGTPHHANIVITNPAPSTIAKMRKEKAPVTIKAGYEGRMGLIFQGEVFQVRNGRENVVDTYVHVLATSQSDARNYAVVNKTLSAGHKISDRIDAVVEAMKPFGVKRGQIDDLGSRQFGRGFAFTGMAHDLLRRVCEMSGATWHIQGDKLHVVKTTGALQGDVLILNSDTGLLGLPEQTIQGVIFRCHLNPTLYPLSKVKINESSVQQAAFNPATAAGASNETLRQGGILGIAADGIYKVWRVDHHGDTRGNDYYTEGACSVSELPPALSDTLIPGGVPGDGDGGAQGSGNASSEASDGARATASPTAFSDGSVKAGPR